MITVESVKAGLLGVLAPTAGNPPGPGFQYKSPPIDTGFLPQLFNFTNAIEGIVEAILLLMAGAGIVASLFFLWFGMMGSRVSLHKAKIGMMGSVLLVVLVFAWPHVFTALAGVAHKYL